MKTSRIPLNTGWRFREAEPRGTSPASELGWLEAAVPGHVHLDLARHGVIEDPFRRMAERGCAWVDEQDWVYETVFHLDAAPSHAFLRFGGLDTVAEVALNGEPVGRADNMFAPHEFAADGRLRAGEGEAGDNTLTVVFRSALRVGRERQQAWAAAGEDTLAPHWFVWGPRAFVRKAQYMYGWDWGPELVSCGLWQPVELVVAPMARLAGWRHEVDFRDDGSALVTVTADVERSPGHEETPLLFLPGMVLDQEWQGVDEETEGPGCVPVAVPTGSGTVRVSAALEVERPRRWWPNGMSGDLRPWLYHLALSVYAADGGAVYDEATTRIGLRTVELVREPEADGAESFRFRVNGEDVFAKGANWVPADSFPSRLAAGRFTGLSPEEYANRTVQEDDPRVARDVAAAAAAGMNMLRVWGGGLYESEHFYALCDQHGLLVWQDFPYACSYYPDTGAYAEASRLEARAAVRRIRSHPSLALWCGNNENQMLFEDAWQGADNRPPRFLGEHLYDRILPEVVRAEDPRTPYWPSSPWGGRFANSPDAGDRHNWDVWHGGGDWRRYLEDDARFVSEFGFASSCGLSAWDRCLDESDRWPRSPAVRWHDKTQKGYGTYLGYVAQHFPEPQTLEDLVYYTQINQAEALKCGVEHWRRRKGRCWGTLFWQLNDCWPVQSWSVIDYAGERKAAWYAAKRFYAPVLVSLVERDGAVEAHLTSDLAEHAQGDVTVSVETFDGDVLVSETFDAYLEANGTALVGSIPLQVLQAHRRDVYVRAVFEPYWEIGTGPVENVLLLAAPKDLRLPDAGLRVDVAGEDAGAVLLRVSAARFAAWTWLRFEGLVVALEDNFTHLRAGETRTLRVPKAPGLETPAEVLARLRVRSL